MKHDASSTDFLQHLAARLAVDRSTALLTLADWLGTYRPRAPRPIEFLVAKQAALP
jgi:hypothetical protein